MTVETAPTPAAPEATLDGRPLLRAFVRDDETRAMIEKAAVELALETAEIMPGTIEDAIRRLGVERSPRLLVVELADAEMALTRVDELAEVCEPGTAVVVLGAANDVGLFRELLRRGVTDYLVIPPPWTVLVRSLADALEDRRAVHRPIRGGRTILVFGARGGVGVTRLASLLAHRLATGRRRRVALFDLDLVFGDVALGFDLDPSPALREVFEDPARADGLWIERAGRVVDEVLWVFGAEEPLQGWPPSAAGALAAVTEVLRQRFHYVVFDCPHGDVETLTAALEASDVAFLVSEPNLAGIRDTLRLLRYVPEVNASCHVHLVLNRVGALPRAEIAVEDFRKALDRDVDFVLPADPALADAANRGQPPKRLSRASERALADMIGRLSGAPASTSRLARIPLLGRLLG